MLKQVTSHMLDVLELSLLLLVLDGFLIDHIVQEKEVNPCPYLPQNLDQFKTRTFLHDVKFLLLSKQRVNVKVELVGSDCVIAQLYLPVLSNTGQ